MSSSLLATCLKLTARLLVNGSSTHNDGPGEKMLAYRNLAAVLLPLAEELGGTGLASSYCFVLALRSGNWPGSIDAPFERSLGSVGSSLGSPSSLSAFQIPRWTG